MLSRRLKTESSPILTIQHNQSIQELGQRVQAKNSCTNHSTALGAEFA